MATPHVARGGVGTMDACVSCEKDVHLETVRHRQGWRCYYCQRVFCGRCASVHFGPNDEAEKPQPVGRDAKTEGRE